MRARGLLLTSALGIVLALLPALSALAATTISLDPTQGPPGSQFVIAGQGFTAGEKVRIRWDGKPLGPPVSVDAEGRFSVFRTVPVDAVAGDHQVSAATQPGEDNPALATFTVLGTPPPTTTTTDPGASTTTTTTPAGTTTTAPTETTTTTANSSTTTTSAGGSGLVFATDVEVDPGEGAPGTEFDITATLTGSIDKVDIWVEDIRLGQPVTVGSDGSFRATRTVPDLEPGIYWLTIRTPEGEIITARSFEVLQGSDASPSMPASNGGILANLISPAYGVLAAVILIALLSIWWMWRRPKTEEKPPTPAPSAEESEGEKPTED